MKILAFSDLHHSQSRAAQLVAASAKADLVIGAGDFCNMRQGLDDAMALLSDLQAPLVAIPGNAESYEELQAAASGSTHVLHGSGIDINGLKLFGLGYGVPVTPFGSWSCDLTEAHAAEILSRCETADILICHSPPKGIADKTSAGQSVGSTAILEAIERIQPRLVFCGHIHDSWGETGHVGQTQIVNLGPTPNWYEIDPSDCK